MLQGAACFSRPLYGHSHFKKFWLKKMEREDEESSLLEPDPFGKASESFGGGIFWHSNDVNCSRLEMKGCSRPSIGVSASRSGSSSSSRRQMFAPFPEESQSLNESERRSFDCALSIGMKAPREKERERESEREEEEEEEEKNKEYSAAALRNNLHGEKSGGLHKFRVHSLRRLLHSESDSQVWDTVEKSAENEFSDRSVTRTCSDCKTDKTPLWRNGPNGPKSLCNACGIRYKKIGKQRCVSNGSGEHQKAATKFPASASSVRQMTKFNKRKQDTADLSSPDTAAVASQPRKKSNANATDRHHGNDSDRVVAPEKGTCGDNISRSFGKDEEEGAVLLMGLSCGLVNA